LGPTLTRAVPIVRLPFTPPLCPDNLFGHLAATAVPGVEEVRGETYRRTLRLPGGPAIVELTPREDHVECAVLGAAPADVEIAARRCRFLIDLDADTPVIDAHLAADPALAPLIAERPGRRIPRTVDGGEMAIRVVIGQQISTAAARTHTARLVLAFGEPIVDPGGGLTHLFPEPAALLDAEPGFPESRRRTLRALFEALASGALVLDPAVDRERALAELDAIPGVGPWTLAIVAMRALGDGDAFPASDLGVRHAATALGLPAAPRALTEAAQAWRPWRAYAVQYLWGVGSHPINDWPPRS
jgi:AraC family transcriptional regulator, regulatory protein of adaptative response / DNA-3-methyladenine glycosylase II